MLALWERAPRSLTDLAEEIAMDPATASPLVKRLESQGLVKRERRAGDERRLDITLTAEGQDLREKALDVPPQVAEATGLSLDQLIAIRNALAPIAGRA
jgi:DNA-binding MarR family transcriptional regulator